MTETKLIVVDAWCIDSPGDPSFGIFDYQEIIQGPFTYDTLDDLELSRKAYQTVFEISLNVDNVRVTTLKEWRQQIKEEE